MAQTVSPGSNRVQSITSAGPINAFELLAWIQTVPRRRGTPRLATDLETREPFSSGSFTVDIQPPTLFFQTGY